MTHTWSTDSYATYPQIHPGMGGRGAGDSVNGWGRKRVSLQPVVHRQPVSWPEEHDVTISVGVLGAGGGLLGLNWSEHASSRKGGGDLPPLQTPELLRCFSGLSGSFIVCGVWMLVMSEELMLGPVSCLQASSDKKSDWGQRLRSRPRRPRQTAPASTTGRPRSCRIPWLWFGYCLVFLSRLELQQFHYALSFISSFHFFYFFLHWRTETVRCSCQCSLAPPSYIKKQFTHWTLWSSVRASGQLLSSLGEAATFTASH